MCSIMNLLNHLFFELLLINIFNRLRTIFIKLTHYLQSVSSASYSKGPFLIIVIPSLIVNICLYWIYWVINNTRFSIFWYTLFLFFQKINFLKQGYSIDSLIFSPHIMLGKYSKYKKYIHFDMIIEYNRLSYMTVKIL